MPDLCPMLRTQPGVGAQGKNGNHSSGLGPERSMRRMPKRFFAIYWFQGLLESQHGEYQGNDPSAWFWAGWRETKDVRLIYIAESGALNA